jgi:AcrR family transcriptional regulator
MNRIANDGRREYRSALRDRQAEATRSRILDATVRVMGRGLAGTSIPAIAREAGVSVPTVYRHFRTKRDLFSALYPHVVYRGAMSQLPLPDSLDGFGPALRKQFASLDAIGDTERAAMASPAGEEARRSNMPRRIARTRELADAIVPAGSTIDRERLTRLLVILTGQAAFRTWRDHLGCTPDEAADDVEWAIRTLIDVSTRNDNS